MTGVGVRVEGGEYLANLTTKTNLDFLSYVTTLLFFKEVDQLWQQFFLDVLQHGWLEGKVLNEQQEISGQHAPLTSHQGCAQVQDGKEKEAADFLRLEENVDFVFHHTDVPDICKMNEARMQITMEDYSWQTERDRQRNGQTQREIGQDKEIQKFYCPHTHKHANKVTPKPPQQKRY